MTSPSSPSNASPSFKIHHLFFSFFILGAWLIYMTIKNQWFLFIDNWFMSVTMLFGSFIAGATAEGGGAVAFPVMTLVFKIPPAVARNFSLAIQSCGMTSAAYLIFTRGIKIEKTYLTLCTLGGFFGIIFGTYAIVPLVTPIYAKMFFVSLWLSFGIVLYVMNLHPERVTVETLPPLKTGGRLFLIVIGFLGGIVSGIVGSGIDILTFSIVTTRYRLCEKVATPTSVCLMAINTVIGFLTHCFLIQDFGQTEFQYWLVAIPVVIFFAPLGAFFISNQAKSFLLNFLYFVLVLQFAGAVLILKPWNSPALLGFSLATFMIGLVLFFGFSDRSYQTTNT